MSAHHHKTDPQKNLAEIVAPDKEKCAKIPPEELARIAKLERIERQLAHLIGQVRELKTT